MSFSIINLTREIKMSELKRLDEIDEVINEGERKAINDTILTATKEFKEDLISRDVWGGSKELDGCKTAQEIAAVIEVIGIDVEYFQYPITSMTVEYSFRFSRPIPTAVTSQIFKVNHYEALRRHDGPLEVLREHAREAFRDMFGESTGVYLSKRFSVNLIQLELKRKEVV
jgi:hypothetical protein